MKANWIVFLESNTSGSGRLFLEAAKRRSLKPVLLARDPARYDFGIECIHQIDTHDVDRIIEFCAALRQTGRIAAIMSSSEYFVETAAICARAFDLPGPDAEAIGITRDKAAQRCVLLNAGVPVPRFTVVRSVSEAIEFAQSSALPVVLKPRRGSGSVGVRLCRSLSEVGNHASSLLSAPSDTTLHARANGCLIESYLDGQEFSVEIFDGTVVGATCKHLGQPPTFVEIGHDFPGAIDDALRCRLAATALTASQVLGLGFGALHVELRLALGNPYIVEVNPRLAGGMIPELVKLATGIDLIEWTLDKALGQASETSPRLARYASIRFLCVEHAGRLSKLDADGAWALQRSGEQIELYVQPDRFIEPHGDFRDRIGHVIAVGDTPRTAAERAEILLAAVEFRLDPCQKAQEV